MRRGKMRGEKRGKARYEVRGGVIDEARYKAR
jgi:hypothetical protein